MPRTKRDDPTWQSQYMYRPRGGNAAIKSDGYIDLAHDEGLAAVDSLIIQTPSETNGQSAIVRVAVTTRKGTYSAHGSSNPKDAEGKPLVQMAETRALTRALALATNNGLGESEDGHLDEPADPEPKPSTPGRGAEASPQRPQLTPVPAARADDAVAERPATQAQLVTITKLAQQLGEEIPDVSPEMGHDAAEELIRQLNDSWRRQRAAGRRA